LDSCSTKKIVVMKLGGSILADKESYRHAARFLVKRLHKCSRERFVVVVSAQDGHTNKLEAFERTVTAYPSPRTLDLLWSTGELRSVALLTLHLEELGVPAAAMNVHEAGLRWNGAAQNGNRVEALSMELRRALDDHSVVVVPGFFATLTGGMLVSLGRGGSDLSAVLFANELGADQCELIKDVPGYFSQDPHMHPDPQHLPHLSYEQALAMAEDRCDLVQQRALEAAQHARLRLVVRSMDETAPTSIVSGDGAIR